MEIKQVALTFCFVYFTENLKRNPHAINVYLHKQNNLQSKIMEFLRFLKESVGLGYLPF